MTKIELFKIFRKKEFFILACMLILPIIFGLLMLTGTIKSGNVGTGSLSLPGFAAVVFGFFEQLGVLGLLTGILAVSTLSTEIDNHHVLLYFPRISSRKRLYSEKILALTIAFTIWFFCFVFVACLAYWMLVFNGSGEVSGLMTDSVTLEWAICLLATYFYVVFIMHFALFLGSYQKPTVSIICLLGLVYGGLLLSKVPGLGHLLPIHYMQAAMEVIGNNETVSVLTNYAISVALSLLYMAICSFLGRRRISRIEV
jgi:hypothetical protein